MSKITRLLVVMFHHLTCFPSDHSFVSLSLPWSSLASDYCFVFLRQFPRVRGRGWNRGNYPGNNSNGNPANVNPVVRPPEDEWDPEYTPKSRKYYLVSQ